MNKYERALLWLVRAKSNLSIAKWAEKEKNVFYEDLCFEAEQAAEKALKALCILFDVKFPRTHNIHYLVELLDNSSLKLPEELTDITELTNYSVETRYPGEYEPVSREEYIRAITLSTKLIEFAEYQITSSDKLPFNQQ